MSSEQITPPPPEAERAAKKPWRKPRLMLVEFATTESVHKAGTSNVSEPAPHKANYDPNFS